MVWTRTAGAPAGIRFIDEPPASGREGVTARLSRGAGLPESMPDVLGLGLRIDQAHGAVDVNLSSTGRGFPGRFLLALHRSPASAWFGSLMPYGGTRGPVLVAARPRGAIDPVTGEWTLDVYHSGVRSKWHRFAELRLLTQRGDSDELRLDPLMRVPPGATTYEWTRLLREPSYRRARLG